MVKTISMEKFVDKKNKKDLDKVPKNVLNNIKVITAEEISTVLENAIIGGKLL